MNPLMYGMMMASAFPKENFNENLNAAITSGINMSNKNAQTMLAVVNTNNSQDSNRRSEKRVALAMAAEVLKAIGENGHLKTDDEFAKDYPNAAGANLKDSIAEAVGKLSNSGLSKK